MITYIYLSVCLYVCLSTCLSANLKKHTSLGTTNCNLNDMSTLISFFYLLYEKLFRYPENMEDADEKEEEEELKRMSITW